jgi:hypothetical protein
MSTDGDLHRAGKWLKAHGALDVAPTPLLAARLRARRRREPVLLAVGGALAVLNGFLDSRLSVGHGSVFRALDLLAIALLTVPAQWLSLRVLRRADRRIGATVARRVTHPAALGWRELLGPRRLAVAAIMYGSALALGVVDLGYAPTRSDRVVMAVLVVAIVALAAITVAWINEVVRRPALADDEISLAADDVLRTEDGHVVTVTAQPAVLALIVTLTMTRPLPTPVYAACYALVVLGVLAWFLGQHIAPPNLRSFNSSGPVSDRLRYIP